MQEQWRINGVAPKGRASLALAVALTLVASVIVVGVSAPQAFAIECGSDTWATNSWNDNYYVQWGCDAHGEYTRGA